MKGNGDLIAMGALVLLIFGGLIAVMFWSSQDFANRCERAGGVNIDYEICIPAGTQVLMTS